MKRIILLCISCFLTLVLVFQFSACGEYVYTNSGIENFSVEDSAFGLNPHLFPKDFLELYPYIDGGYDYYEKSDAYAYVTSLIYTVYDEATYLDAKNYALENLEYLEDSAEQYKGYSVYGRTLDFYDKFYKGHETNYKIMRFYFAYSDENRTLVAFATYMLGYYEYEYTTLSEYFETYFPFYNFETGKIERELSSDSDIATSET